MHDNPSLRDALPSFTPTGALTFTFSGGALGANAATEAGFYATSANTAALAAQVAAYSFSAAYAGDSNYNAIPSGTHNPETFFVDKGTLTLTTTVHDARPHRHRQAGGRRGARAARFRDARQPFPARRSAELHADRGAHVHVQRRRARGQRRDRGRLLRHVGEHGCPGGAGSRL